MASRETDAAVRADGGGQAVRYPVTEEWLEATCRMVIHEAERHLREAKDALRRGYMSYAFRKAQALAYMLSVSREV